MRRALFEVTRRAIRLTAVTGCLLTVGSAASAQRAAPADDETTLKPGDAVRLTVWRNTDLTGEFTIGPDGSIMHPMMYRKFSVANVPLRLAENSVREFLSRYEANPEFVMEPLLRVSVSGEVARPNLYQIRPGTTLTQAIALAGGPTDRGRWDRFTLRRNGTSRTISANDAERSEGQLHIRSGDEIIVERRRAIFREVIAPSAAIIGAVAAVLNVTTRDR